MTFQPTIVAARAHWIAIQWAAQHGLAVGSYRTVVVEYALDYVPLDTHIVLVDSGTQRGEYLALCEALKRFKNVKVVT